MPILTLPLPLNTQIRTDKNTTGKADINTEYIHSKIRCTILFLGLQTDSAADIYITIFNVQFNMLLSTIPSTLIVHQDVLLNFWQATE